MYVSHISASASDDEMEMSSSTSPEGKAEFPTSDSPQPSFLAMRADWFRGCVFVHLVRMKWDCCYCPPCFMHCNVWNIFTFNLHMDLRATWWCQQVITPSLVTNMDEASYTLTWFICFSTSSFRSNTSLLWTTVPLQDQKRLIALLHSNSNFRERGRDL